MDEKDKMKNFDDYWGLVNNIDSLCQKAIEKGLLYGDDVISALDRVKMSWFQEHLECKYNLETDKDDDIKKLLR